MGRLSEFKTKSVGIWRATAFLRGERLIVSSRQRHNTKGFKHIVKTLLSITFTHSKRGHAPAS